MKLNRLIEILEIARAGEGGDIEVILSVTQHEHDAQLSEEVYHGDVTGATAEQDHDSEAMFVRISGDDKE